MQIHVRRHGGPVYGSACRRCGRGRASAPPPLTAQERRLRLLWGRECPALSAHGRPDRAADARAPAWGARVRACVPAVWLVEGSPPSASARRSSSSGTVSSVPANFLLTPWLGEGPSPFPSTRRSCTRSCRANNALTTQPFARRVDAPTVATTRHHIHHPSHPCSTCGPACQAPPRFSAHPRVGVTHPTHRRDSARFAPGLFKHTAFLLIVPTSSINSSTSPASKSIVFCGQLLQLLSDLSACSQPR